MTKLSDYFQRVLTGQQPGGFNGILCDLSTPRGASGAYTLDMANAVILATEMSLLSSAGGTLDSEGFFTWTSAVPIGSSSGAPPRLTSVTREYLFEIKTLTTPADGNNIYCIFNYVDASNYWVIIFQYLTASTLYQAYLYEITGGSGTQRGVINMSTTLDHPSYFRITVRDYGDRVTLFVDGWKTDNTSLYDSKTLTYTVASRPNKGGVGFYINLVNGNKYAFRRMRVADV